MRRFRGARGVTMVEYALVGALLVGASVGAIEFLSDASEDQTMEQVDCISTRPPPVSCQMPTAATTTTSTSIGGPPTSPPPPPIPPPPPPPPSRSVVDGATPPPVPGTAPGSFVVSPPNIRVETGDDPPFPVDGAEIEFTLEVEDPTSPGTWVVLEVTSCTTGTNGQCSTMPSFEILAGNYVPPIRNARITVTDIQSDPAVSSLPAPFTYTLA